MAEIVLFSDFHANNFRYGHTRIPHPDALIRGTYNSRLIDCVLVLRDIEQYCLDNNIETVLFGGDLFHRRTVIHTDVFTVVHRELARLAQVVNIVMIPGNHDYGDRAGYVHSLAPFKDLEGITVLDSVCGYSASDELAIYSVPYTDDPGVAKQRLTQAGFFADQEEARTKILLAHLGMQGAKVGSDYVLLSESDIQSTDVPHEKFDACFFGHYHQHQKLFKNGWFIGATHHHNWGDADTSRGFLHATISGGSVSFKQVETSAPRFLNYEEGQSMVFRSRDFVRYHYNGVLVGGSSEIKDRLGVAHLDPIQHQEETEEELEIPEDCLEPRKLAQAWVDTYGEGDQELKDFGLNILAEAEGEVI